MTVKPVRFVQVSDTHFFADGQRELLGVNTRESLEAIVGYLSTCQSDYDFIIHSGDLSQDYSIQSYENIVNCFEKLDKPIYFVPGNHDDPLAMAKVFPAKNWLTHKQLVLQDWQLILLNSHQNKSVAGRLHQEQLLYLEACLAGHPDKHTLIVLHHNPVSVGIAWLDEFGLQNADEFWQIVEHYDTVRAVLFGHVHQEFIGARGNTQCYAVPSTCIQFKPQQEEFGLDRLPPGFRLVTLNEAGDISTEVRRLDHYIGQFAVDAKGY